MKTKIIVKESNLEKIETIIAEVEKGARTRRIVSSSVLYIAEELDKRLLPFICKKNLKGTVAHVDYHAQNFAKSYNGVPLSTKVELEHNGKEWVLTSVDRCRTSSEASAFDIRYTEKAKQDIVKHMETFRW